MDPFNDFDAHFKSTRRLAGIWFAVTLTIGAAMATTIIWAVYRLVTHFLG